MKLKLYTVETEDGITYEGIFAPTKLEAAKQVAEVMDTEDEILEVTQIV
ncbi:hypothetical protein ACQEV9_15455 [Streptomyces chartreusis]